MKLKKAVKSIFRKALFSAINKINNQHIQESIFQLSLKKMNYGHGGNFSESGELFVIKYIKKKLLNESPVIIFDVGANNGNYSKTLSENFNGETKIFSFEPSKKTYEIFLETIKQSKNIIPNNFGFSDKKYNETLFSNSEGSGLASVYQRKLDHFGITMDMSEEIRLTTIDSFCQENNIERIHFLKLDIEGHELNALKGAMKMITSNKIDFIQFEFGGCNIDSRTFFQDFFYLLKDRYTIYRILKDGLAEMPAYRESYEIFLTINFLAIRK